MDIGLDQHDSALGGEGEDIFDLEHAEKGMRRTDASRFVRGRAGESEEEEEASSDNDREESDEALDSEEELEKKTRALEDDLDNLYTSYRERLAERDAKFRVKEMRKKNKDREAWHGIKKPGSDDEDDEGEESEGEEGGWDTVQKSKARDEDSSSDEDDSSDGEASVERKRTRNVGPTERANKRRRLVTDLQNPISTSGSRNADLWFSQDVFAGIGNLEDVEDEDEEMEDGAEDSEDSEAEEPVRFL
jgi:AdoMet-dependent rRNA methyltransferase SPB1